MLQSDPTLAPDDVKCRLLASARPAVSSSGDAGLQRLRARSGTHQRRVGRQQLRDRLREPRAQHRGRPRGTQHFGGPANEDANGNFYVMNMAGSTWGGSQPNDGYSWSTAYDGSQGYTWSEGYVWSQSYNWNQAYTWNNGYTWSQGLHVVARATPGADRYPGGARTPRPLQARNPRPSCRGCPISDMRTPRRCFLTLGILSSLLLVAAARAAEAPPLVLEHLTPSEGLPQGTVYDSLQDSQGFVWLATEDGLVRYDGLELYRYAYSRTAGSGLPGNFIREIVEDARHDLWIAIKDAGLARWNRATDTFTRFRHDPKDPGSLASDVTRAVLVDTRGRIWIGTNDAGIDILDPASGRIEHRRHDPRNADSLSDDQIFTLALDRSGAVWVGTAAGLDRWQPERNAFLHFREDRGALTGKQVSAMIEDHGGSLGSARSTAASTTSDSTGNLIESFRHEAQRPPRSRATACGPSSRTMQDICGSVRKRASICWIATTGEFSHYRHDDSDAASLRDSFIMSLYQDSAGLVWIGTRARRREPLESAQLGARRPPAGMARRQAGDLLCRCPRSSSMDCIHGRRPQAIRRKQRRGQGHRRHRRPARCARRSSRHGAASGSSRYAVDRHDGERAQEIDGERTARVHSGQTGDPHGTSAEGIRPSTRAATGGSGSACTMAAPM